MIKKLLLSPASVLLIILVFASHAHSKNDTAAYSSVKKAINALLKNPHATINTTLDWTIISISKTKTIWHFTREGHPAHPSAISRKPFVKGRKIFIKMRVLCESNKAECEKIAADFTKKNQQIAKDYKNLQH